MTTKEAMKPSPRLISKLASLVVHFDEMTGSGGHNFDRIAAEQLINDPEIKEWLKALGPLAPVKRI